MTAHPQIPKSGSTPIEPNANALRVNTPSTNGGNPEAKSDGTGGQKLAGALALAALGLNVFPWMVVEAAGKKPRKVPAIKKWPERATTDPDKVRAMWTSVLDEVEDLNIGVAAGRPLPSGDVLVVIDFDTEGDPIPKKMKDFEARFGAIPKTQTVKTTSGGIHFYLRVPAGVLVSNSQSVLAPHVDVRGDCGFVAAPGSSMAGALYEWVKGLSPADAEIAACPEKLLDALRAKRPRTANNDKGELRVIGEVDSRAALDRAIKTLRDAPPAIEYAGGRKVTHTLAHKLIDDGCSPEGAASLMSEYWDDRNSPPWGDEALLKEVLSLMPSRQNPAGCAAVENAFEAVDEVAPRATASPNAKPEKPYLTADEAEALALESDGEELVKGWIDRGALSVWYGPPGSGKSAVVLNLALAVAAGVPWAGFETRQGLVVYAALERARGMRKRIMAARKRMNLPAGLPLVVLTFRPDFAAGYDAPTK